MHLKEWKKYYLSINKYFVYKFITKMRKLDYSKKNYKNVEDRLLRWIISYTNSLLEWSLLLHLVYRRREKVLNI